MNDHNAWDEPGCEEYYVDDSEMGASYWERAAARHGIRLTEHAVNDASNDIADEDLGDDTLETPWNINDDDDLGDERSTSVDLDDDDL